MISLQNVTFQYREDGFTLDVPHLEIKAGSKTAVVGPSGSGKTTFLRLLSGIAMPGKGNIRIGPTEISSLSDSDRRDFRISRIGFVFQEFELIEYLSVLENILLPFYINGSMDLTDEVRDRATDLARTMHLGELLKRNVGEISQGEKQRVAICRAMLIEPEVILADEPTGNLDPANKERIVELLFERTTATKATLVMVTHDHSLLGGFDEVLDFEQLLKLREA